jgi:dihydroorotase
MQVRYRAAPPPEYFQLGCKYRAIAFLSLYCAKFCQRFMKILIKQATIIHPDSPYHLQSKDILLENGVIIQIGNNSDLIVDEIIQGEDIYLTHGWIDIFAQFHDPGAEHKETIATGAAAAAAGGYTTIFAIPNTNPVLQHKTQVEYIKQRNQLYCTILPLGAVSKNIEGKELAEMMDMYYSGAIAFSDGIKPIQNAGLLLKALQYIKAFNGVLIQVPDDTSIAGAALMHEGIISTQMGLPGKPMMAEELIIARDIKLARYTDSAIHFTAVSSPKSIEYIKRAKDAGINVTCSVTPYHLMFCDEDLQQYDTNLKVNPPLRSRADMLALRKAVADGVIDCIASHHIPQDIDSKQCEFEYAKHGMIGLQTCFAAVNTAIPDLSAEKIHELFSGSAAQIFKLPLHPITEGCKANFTIYSKKGITQLSKENNKSKSSNSPFMNIQLKGKVIATICNGNLNKAI